MKCRFRPSERLEFELEGGQVKDLFQQVAEIAEIFSDEACGLCGCEDTRFVVREVDSHKYYELRCNKCGGKLAFGQARTGGGLFPKRKVEVDGEERYDREHYGWHRYTPPTDASSKKGKR